MFGRRRGRAAVRGRRRQPGAGAPDQVPGRRGGGPAARRLVGLAVRARHRARAHDHVRHGRRARGRRGGERPAQPLTEKPLAAACRRDPRRATRRAHPIGLPRGDVNRIARAADETSFFVESRQCHCLLSPPGRLRSGEPSDDRGRSPPAMATAAEKVLKPDFDSRKRHFIFTDEHEALRESIRNFCTKELAPHAEEWEETTFPNWVFERMGELGYLGLSYPEEYGGQGGDYYANLVLAEEIGAARSGGLAMGIAVHTDMATPPVF